MYVVYAEVVIVCTRCRNENIQYLYSSNENIQYLVTVVGTSVGEERTGTLLSSWRGSCAPYVGPVLRV